MYWSMNNNILVIMIMMNTQQYPEASLRIWVLNEMDAFICGFCVEDEFTLEMLLNVCKSFSESVDKSLHCTPSFKRFGLYVAHTNMRY